ncbi:hypothetical protein HCCG_00414 [Helicobacter cinaedi CCUG 18818 = ATCC BAA-847]|uniref:Uncharacterized protein n=1 Tax=Helicobacter cinaedi CCUG 18818 = ATCC BAA-847 TaxID=537971 RepID=A0ABN0B8W4_9HELI|nr:hypothetical protein [Helicobacter cinaedi]EFR45868.1 hypothetical protein HCCG_00414 [Helicobacter cinaedi CCUG 18818 = ATCC BAA-847]
MKQNIHPIKFNEKISHLHFYAFYCYNAKQSKNLIKQYLETKPIKE